MKYRVRVPVRVPITTNQGKKGIILYWNYRRLKAVDPNYPEDILTGITEVFYDEDGSIIGWISIFDIGGLYSEDEEGLQASFDNMKLAFEKPVLIEKDLPGYNEERNKENGI